METVETPLSEIERVYSFFHDPAHMPELQVASDKTLYVWQHMSGFQYTAQVLRDGPIRELPERLDPAIARIEVSFSDGSKKKCDEYFDTSTMDALLVLREGNVVYERYKTMRPFDKHNWFSCSKTIAGTAVALLEHAGKVDVSQPVSRYLPELGGSEWDNVTVEQTLDMATGLDSTEHEVPDARTNPARGWYKWAVSIGLFEDVHHLNQSPFDVLRGMKRVKPGHTAFEYNSLNTFVLQSIAETVTRKPIHELLGDLVWRKIGAQNDGYLGLNKTGHANAWGFMNSTLRDLGRYGLAYTPSGKQFSGQEVVPEAVVRRFQTGLRPEMYTKGSVGRDFQKEFFQDPGLSNRYQWDAVFPDGDLFKAGVGGQGLFISPSRDTVVAFFSTGAAADERRGALLARTIRKTFAR